MGFSGGAPAAGGVRRRSKFDVASATKRESKHVPPAAVRLAAQQSTVELPNGPGAVGLPDIACDPSDWDREWLGMAGTGCRDEGSKLLLCWSSGSLAGTARRRTSALPAGGKRGNGRHRRTRSRIGVEAPLLTWPGSNRCFSAFTSGCRMGFLASGGLVFLPPLFPAVFFFSLFERGLAVV